MLSQELRPHKWSDMAGQKENVRILRAIIKNPESAPKCLIFQGAFGCGKSTSARIIARELNNFKGSDEELLASSFYYEFDSTVIGNVDEIRKMREQFAFSYGDYYRVVVLDESQSISIAAQNALLKMLEEATGRIFYIFCTTNIEKMLPTIRSRSLELHFNPVSVDDIIKNLDSVAEKRGISLSDDIKVLIADRSAGHMRNAHMLLDKYLLLGERDFKDSIKSAVTLYCDYLIAIKNNDSDGVLAGINDLMNIPKDNLQSDWSVVMTESLKSFCGFEIEHEDVKRLVKIYGKEFQLVVNCYMSNWIRNAFVDMPYFQATFLNLYLVLRNAFAKLASQSAVSNRVVSGFRPVR